MGKQIIDILRLVHNINAMKIKNIGARGEIWTPEGLLPVAFEATAIPDYATLANMSPGMLELNIHGNYFEVSLTELVWNGKLQLMTK